ncbi:AraC family transcriptional regulator [Chryseobacterium populi]|uniref:DNA-binding domain-containing protein, AraC-type n=1 Tax=Chryseobacterium populi TaxID=1144316 RepID=J2SSN0_9FLAO|nr:AraC family transcriptional regulator [Chryseobacterium populi]EJL68557.1 DNA-binding domain-containing protein, AraC-type [Chryseobacterium populi]
MKNNFLHEPYSIHFETLDVFPEMQGRKNFFELVFILTGTGQHCINQHSFSYYQNHMFLLTPQDCSKFSIDETTRFFFLRFSNIYLKNNGISKENIQRLEFILQNANHRPGCILKNQSDKALVRPVIEALIREAVNKDIYHSEITEQLINTLIVVVARNIAKYLPQKIDETSDERIIDILNYIQSNIYEPERIRTESICKEFGISGNYLGKYFKKHSGETLQSYINNYKITLIEHRLKYSDRRITEIASELGFTDESHLNKFFKAQRGKSPKTFRMEFAGQ